MPRRRRLVVETYEPSRRYPIVVHVFQGDTKAEAEGYFRSHLQTDSFLRQCVEGRGPYGCEARYRWR